MQYGTVDQDDWDRRYEAVELLWTAEPNRFLVTEIGGLTPGEALDVGAGEGRNAVWLAEQGWRVTAVDFSSVGMAKARRLAEARRVEVEWVLADLRSYAPETDRYDLVVVLYLHLTEEPRRRVHATVARSLREGGTLLVVGHDRSNLYDGVGGPQDPAVMFTPDDIVSDLSGVGGLSVARAERVHRPVKAHGEERVAIDALVRAVRTEDG